MLPRDVKHTCTLAKLKQGWKIVQSNTPNFSPIAVLGGVGRFIATAWNRQGCFIFRTKNLKFVLYLEHSNHVTSYI